MEQLPIAERYLFLRLRSVAARIRKPKLPLAGRTPSNEPPLDLRTPKFYTAIHCETKSKDRKSCILTVFHLQFENIYDKNKTCIKSIVYQIEKHIDDSIIHLDIV